jgi:hypothetical protein
LPTLSAYSPTHTCLLCLLSHLPTHTCLSAYSPTQTCAAAAARPAGSCLEDGSLEFRARGLYLFALPLLFLLERLPNGLRDTFTLLRKDSVELRAMCAQPVVINSHAGVRAVTLVIATCVRQCRSLRVASASAIAGCKWRLATGASAGGIWSAAVEDCRAHMASDGAACRATASGQIATGERRWWKKGKKMCAVSGILSASAGGK